MADLMENRNSLTNDVKSSNLSVLDDALSKLDKKQIKEIAMHAMKERVRLEVEMAEAERKSRMASVQINQHIGATKSLPSDIPLTGHKLRSEIETGSGKMIIDSTMGRPGASSKCFVATATYQNPQHPDVVYLRRFRDQYLRKRSWGIRFINWYYGSAGPCMAKMIEGHEILRKCSLGMLKSIVFILKALCPISHTKL